MNVKKRIQKLNNDELDEILYILYLAIIGPNLEESGSVDLISDIEKIANQEKLSRD